MKEINKEKRKGWRKKEEEEETETGAGVGVCKKEGKRRKAEKKDIMYPGLGRLFRQQIFLIKPKCYSARQKKCSKIRET